MKNYRPSYECIYVIPEIHGNITSIKIIFNRIFPLRFSDGRQDRVVLLGDFIDKGNDSAEVIQLLIDYKKEYGDNLICIRGNHEELFLKALKSESDYRVWLLQGGTLTIKSYLDRLNLNSNPDTLPFSRLLDIIPAQHIEFLNSLPVKFILEDYVLFHGGFDLIKSIEETSDYMWTSDIHTSKLIKKLVKDKYNPLSSQDKIYIGSHNYKSKLPFIYAKYFMLGGGAPNNLILFELNSMSCAMIKKNKSRIYKHKFKYYE